MYFYVPDILVTFLDLGEVASVEVVLWVSALPSCHAMLLTQAICSRVSPKRAPWGLLFLAGCVGGLGGLVGP